MLSGLREASEITSVELLEEEMRKVLYLVDENVIRILLACTISIKLNSTVWLMLVAGSSAGKSHLISAVSDLPHMENISDLTMNTFASGQQKPGQNTSLLNKLDKKIMIFKDFTTILSKPNEARDAIIGQMREIYDGSYVKKTGTGVEVRWVGRVGALAACTEDIYSYMNQMAAMGQRFILYSMVAPDRKTITKFVLNNERYEKEMKMHMKICFKNFVEIVHEWIDNGGHSDMKLSDETQDSLIDIANVSTLARSSVKTNFKSGAVEFVPEPEVPLRVIQQLFAIAQALIVINKANKDLPKDHPAHSGGLSEKEMKLLRKISFDSIPRSRRDVLVPMAEYSGGVTTSGLATKLGLPTESVRKFLTEVNALKLCDRIKSGNSDKWMIKDEYRDIILATSGKNKIDAGLEATEDEAEAAFTGGGSSYDEGSLIKTFES